MCNYEYHKHDVCGHQFIELTHYCQKIIWNAGVTGALKPCPEQRFISHVLKLEYADMSDDKDVCYWKGYSGFCKHCEDIFEMPKTFHYATFNDTSFDDGVVAVLPHYVPPSLALSASQPSQCSSNTMTPSPTSNHQNLPYIYTPWVNCTILDLLSVNEQLEPGDDAGTMLFFPENLAEYDLKSAIDSWREQWKSVAHVDGVVAKNLSHHSLAICGGLTRKDWATITMRLLEGDHMFDIWRAYFQPRGMDFMAFTAHDAQFDGIRAMIEQRNKETAARFQEWKLQQPVTPSPPGSVYVDSDSSNFS